MTKPLLIRPATESDAPALLAIYRPFVESTAVSFETVTPSIEEFSARITKAVAGWQWLVAERDSQCLGYAYGTSYRDRLAYRWSVEVSAYMHPSHHRQGIGRALYLQLCVFRSMPGHDSGASRAMIPDHAGPPFR